MTDGKAWVTLATNDSYALGAVVLANSLKRVSTTGKLVVMVTPGVSAPMRGVLDSTFDVVTEVNVLDSEDAANLALLTRPELGITFTKLHCWRLTQYEKCVFLDADTLVLQNCDELFNREEFSAAPDSGWPDCFNSGVFVFQPSLDTYEKLLQFAVEQGSFDGGDQGLLNLYFSDWSTSDIAKHLPFIYNMVATATYSYLPAYRVFGHNVKIAHFIGPSKPWLQFFDSATGHVRPEPGQEHLQELLQAWWDIFRKDVHPKLTPDMGDISATQSEQVLSTSFAHIFTAAPPSHNPSLSNTDPFPFDLGYPPVNLNDLNIAIQRHPPDNVRREQERQRQRELEFQQQQTQQQHFISHDSSSSNDSQTNHNYSTDNNHSHTHDSSNNYFHSPPAQSHNHQYNHSAQVTHHQHNVHHEHSHEHSTQSSNQFAQSHSSNQNPPSNQPEFHSHSQQHTSHNPPSFHHHHHHSPPSHTHCSSSEVPAPTGTTLASCESPDTAQCASDRVFESPSSSNTKGLAGAYAKISFEGAKSSEQLQFEDAMRKNAWEQGRMDYLGKDSFDNIMKKIQASLAQASLSQKGRAKSPSPAKVVPKARSKSPSPPKSQPTEEAPAQQATPAPAPAQEPTPAAAVPPPTVETVSPPVEEPVAAVESQQQQQAAPTQESQQVPQPKQKTPEVESAPAPPPTPAPVAPAAEIKSEPVAEAAPVQQQQKQPTPPPTQQQKKATPPPEPKPKKATPPPEQKKATPPPEPQQKKATPPPEPQQKKVTPPPEPQQKKATPPPEQKKATPPPEPKVQQQQQQKKPTPPPEPKQKKATPPPEPKAAPVAKPPQKSAEELEEEQLALERQAIERKLAEQKLVAEQKLQEEKQRAAEAAAATQSAQQPQAPPRGKGKGSKKNKKSKSKKSKGDPPMTQNRQAVNGGQNPSSSNKTNKNTTSNNNFPSNVGGSYGLTLGVALVMVMAFGVITQLLPYKFLPR